MGGRGRTAARPGGDDVSDARIEAVPARRLGRIAVEWIRDRGLALLLMAMFLLFLVGQGLSGLADYNAEQALHGQPTVSMNGYLATGHPWEALFENWESEFLQMAVFVLLTAIVIQKGSPESGRPGVTEMTDADPRDVVARVGRRVSVDRIVVENAEHGRHGRFSLRRRSWCEHLLRLERPTRES